MFILIIYAHRGASGYCPENTMASFKKALDLHSEGIELDVHLSKDNKIIVCHDFTIDRTTNGTGFIKNMTLAQLQSYDYGSWFSEEFEGEKVPLLSDVLELIKDTDVILNIEIKAGSTYYPNMEKILLDQVISYDLLHNIIISSFDHYALYECKKINKDVKTAILYGSNLYQPWEYAKAIHADALHPNYITVSDHLVDNCKKNNLLLNPYTVDSHDIAKKFNHMDVSGLITNYPDIIKA